MKGRKIGSLFLTVIMAVNLLTGCSGNDAGTRRIPPRQVRKLISRKEMIKP